MLFLPRKNALHSTVNGKLCPKCQQKCVVFLHFLQKLLTHWQESCIINNIKKQSANYIHNIMYIMLWYFFCKLTQFLPQFPTTCCTVLQQFLIFFATKNRHGVPVFVLCAGAWGEDATAVDLVLGCLVQGVGFAVAVAPPSHLSATIVRKFLEF